MTGRHRYEPSPDELQQLCGPSDIDCDEPNYAYNKAKELHHAAAIANWDKPAGLHKREKPAPSPAMSPRSLAQVAIAALKLPRARH